MQDLAARVLTKYQHITAEYRVTGSVRGEERYLVFDHPDAPVPVFEGPLVSGAGRAAPRDHEPAPAAAADAA